MVPKSVQKSLWSLLGGLETFEKSKNIIEMPFSDNHVLDFALSAICFKILVLKN